MSTRLDVITRAFRRLGISADDETLTADQIANGGDVLDSLFVEAGREAPMSFDLENVPAESFVALANYLAAEMAADYAVQPPDSPARAKLRFIATVRPDNRMDIATPEYY